MATFQSVSPDSDQPVLKAEEIALIRRIARSRIWKLLQDTFVFEREQLFRGESNITGLTGQPSTTEALWMNRGAILVIQRLLQEGPSLVVWYQRYMDAKRDEKVQEKGTVARPEREYSQAGFTDPPDDFDL